jgi:hypothetical protein
MPHSALVGYYCQLNLLIYLVFTYLGYIGVPTLWEQNVMFVSYAKVLLAAKKPLYDYCPQSR